MPGTLLHKNKTIWARATILRRTSTYIVWKCSVPNGNADLALYLFIVHFLVFFLEVLEILINFAAEKN